MKKGILFLLIGAAFTTSAQSQSLKDLLYSGKLKLDSTSVIRKGDDLSSRIDTSTKKPEAPKPVAATNPAITAGTTAVVTDTVAATVSLGDTTTGNTPAIAATKETATPAKSNTKIWKEYTDSLQASFKSELLPNKKIKKETYFLTVDYEIGTDGLLTVNNVLCTPENDFLKEEVKNRMTLTVPQLAPTLDSSGQPRKVKRKYNFSLTKE
jgi:hypothetical protein